MSQRVKSAMMKLSVGLVMVASLSGCAADPDVPSPSPSRPLRPQVIDGAATVDELDFPIHHLERNAVLGQLTTAYSQTFQGCSGTLVGDRLVMTAGHCVVLNHDDWFGGAEPEVVDPPDRVSFSVGDDVDAPLCLLTAEAIHLHPDIGLSGTQINHDVALVVLQTSTWDSCAATIPVQPNREALDESLLGEWVLQGGFGSVDGTYDFSPLRYWALVGVEAVEPEHVMVQDVGQGFPTYGDSGAGVLRRFPDGSLRNLGVCSTGTGGHMRFNRTDTQGKLFDAVADDTLMCGPLATQGACRDHIAVSCDAQGFWSTDCGPTSEECQVDADGSAACVCLCDTEPFCQPDCVCDAQCPCECDVSEVCDADCPCDARCYDPPPAEPEAVTEGCAMSSGGAATRDGRIAGWLLLGLLCAAVRCRRRLRRARR